MHLVSPYQIHAASGCRLMWHIFFCFIDIKESSDYFTRRKMVIRPVVRLSIAHYKALDSEKICLLQKRMITTSTRISCHAMIILPPVDGNVCFNLHF